MTKKEGLEAQGYKTYEGKGIARKLVLKVVEAARAKGVKILPVCS